MLVLEDGSIFIGQSLGADGEWVGEVVFNTSMTGYQEIITDPSYWGQMVVFTCPHIGNVGVNRLDVESRQPYLRAVLAREICLEPSNWRAQEPLTAYLRRCGVPALSDLDTRRLTLLLREKGTLRAALSTVQLDAERLHRMAQSAPDMSTLRAVPAVSPAEPYPWEESVPTSWAPPVGGDGTLPSQAPHVVVIDCGVKHNILRLLVQCGARVTVLPAQVSAEQVLAAQPDGVLLSNGPGDPEQVPEAIETVRQLTGRVPIFGICLGHQIIGLAAGARKYKLPFGHHGGNHPVKDLATGQVEITAQNHNYAIDAASLAGLPYEATHINLYDGTLEGMRHTELPIWCVQFHPEASPGPHDSVHLIRAFVTSLEA
jgi:carbamoyl-phosphate synthase small subunit